MVFLGCVWVWVYVNNRCDSILCIDWRGTHPPSVFDLCSLVLVFLSEQWRNPWSSCRVAGVGVECVCACINYEMWLRICRCVVCLSLCLASFSPCLLQLKSGMHYLLSHQNGPKFGSPRLYPVIRTRWDLLKPQLNNLLPGT